MSRKLTRLEELNDLGVDYSKPINAFANKAKVLFNRIAREHGAKIRVCDGEYNDGGARLYLVNSYNDIISAVAYTFLGFERRVFDLVSENKKLQKLELSASNVAFHGDEIFINFDDGDN